MQMSRKAGLAKKIAHTLMAMSIVYSSGINIVVNEVYAAEKIKEITGNETTLYRAPYGEYNNTVIKAAKEQGHLAIQWNLDTLDYLNQLNKISKEEAILYGKEYDDFINYKFNENDVLLQNFNDSVKDLQEDFESGLN